MMKSISCYVTVIGAGTGGLAACRAATATGSTAASIEAGRCRHYRQAQSSEEGGRLPVAVGMLHLSL